MAKVYIASTNGESEIATIVGVEQDEQSTTLTLIVEEVKECDE